MTDFHMVSCARAGIAPEPDQESVSVLSRWEREFDVRLPAALFEWFSTAGLLAFVDARSPNDFVSPGPVGGSAWRDRWAVQMLERDLVVVAHENQGVCAWAVPLTRGDDPPVLVAVDPEQGPVWETYAPSVSAYVEAVVWDATVTDMEHWLCCQDPALRPEDLSLLRSEFRECRPTSVWPGRHNYRFEGPGTRVMVWDGDGQSDWFLVSDSLGGVDGLLTTLWNCGSLAAGLYSTTFDDAGRVLDEHRNRGPAAPPPPPDRDPSG